MAYFQIDPFGEERADLRAGIIASTLINANRHKGPAAKPKDFMPRFMDRPQNAAQQVDIIKAWHQQLGGE